MSISWNDTLAPAVANNVAAAGGDGWMLSGSSSFDKIDMFDMWNPVTYTGPSGVAFTYISAGNDGTILGLDGSTTAHFFTALGGWQSVSYSNVLVHGGVGSASNIVVVDSAGNIFEITGPLPNVAITGGSSSGMDRITTASSPSAGKWSLNSVGDIFEWNYTTSSWDVIPGQLFQVHISPNGSRVIGVNSVNGSGWQFNFATRSWLPVTPLPAGESFSRIEASDSCYFALSLTGKVYKGY